MTATIVGSIDLRQTTTTVNEIIQRKNYGSMEWTF
jgi:hypothetical protein